MTKARTARHGLARSAGPGLQDVLVIAFAANRVARALSIDSISAPLRERLTQPPQGTQRPARMRQFAGGLLDCPVCTGWWSSIGVSLMWPGRYRLRRGLAVAGVQVMLTFAERLVSEQGRVAVHEAQSIADA